MIRIGRLSVFLKKVNLPERLKAVVNIFKLTIYLAVYLHINGCLLYIFVNYQGKINPGEEKVFDSNGDLVLQDQLGFTRPYSPWIPPLDWLDYTSGKLFLEDTSLLEKYSVSLYYSVISLGMGELGPVNYIELISAVLNLSISLIINTFVFSELAVLAAILGRRRALSQMNLD